MIPRPGPVRVTHPYRRAMRHTVDLLVWTAQPSGGTAARAAGGPLAEALRTLATIDPGGY
jgi:hypothetical protein